MRGEKKKGNEVRKEGGKKEEEGEGRVEGRRNNVGKGERLD